MTAEFTLEDPEYIAEPLTHGRELIYSPHEEMFRHNCDPGAGGPLRSLEVPRGHSYNLS